MALPTACPCRYLRRTACVIRCPNWRQTRLLSIVSSFATCSGIAKWGQSRLSTCHYATIPCDEFRMIARVKSDTKGFRSSGRHSPSNGPPPGLGTHTVPSSLLPPPLTNLVSRVCRIFILISSFVCAAKIRGRRFPVLFWASLCSLRRSNTHLASY